MLQTYTVFIRYLALSARGRLQVHVPGCIRLGAGEAAMLGILSAGQYSLRAHDERRLRRSLRALTGDRDDESLVLAVQEVARMLQACGLALPERQPCCVKRQTCTPGPAAGRMRLN
jgi:hypothetical protein